MQPIMRSTTLARLLVPALAAGILSACGTGGRSVPSVPVVPASAAPASGAKMSSTVTITLHNRSAAAAAAMRKGKTRNYVSPSTTGVILSVDDTTAKSTTVYGFDVSPQPDANSSCGATQSNGTRICTLGLPLTAGDSVTITGSIYDQIPSPLGLGAVAAGNELAIGTSAATTIVANENNAISITLSGVGARLEALAYGTPYYEPYEQIPMFNLHVEDYDGNPIDAYDPYDTLASPVTVAVTDAGDTSGCTKSSRCLGFNFDLTTTTTSLTSPTGMPQFFLNFGDTTGSTNGTGSETPSTPPYYAEITTTPNTGAVPGGSQSGVAILAPLFAYPEGVSLTGSTPGVVYADQYMLPSGSSGYSIDASKCANLVTAGSAQTAPYGAMFSLTGITNGSCNVTLYDGVSNDQLTDAISVSGFATHAVTKLPKAPTVGNTVLLVVAQGTASASLGGVATPTGFTSVINTPSYSNVNGFAVFAKDVTNPATDQSVPFAFGTGVTGAVSWYIAEFNNTHASLVSSVSSEHGQEITPGSSSSPPPVTPDAPKTYLVTGATSNIYGSLTGTDPYTDSTGFTQSFASGGTSASPVGTDSAALEIQTEPLTANPPTSVTNSFMVTAVSSGSTAEPTTSDFIFYLRPAS
jgi:hypothetical protein